MFAWQDLMVAVVSYAMGVTIGWHVSPFVWRLRFGREAAEMLTKEEQEPRIKAFKREFAFLFTFVCMMLISVIWLDLWEQLSATVPPPPSPPGAVSSVSW